VGNLNHAEPQAFRYDLEIRRAASQDSMMILSRVIPTDRAGVVLVLGFRLQC
jgi:hypothetical protein